MDEESKRGTSEPRRGTQTRTPLLIGGIAAVAAFVFALLAIPEDANGPWATVPLVTLIVIAFALLSLWNSDEEISWRTMALYLGLLPLMGIGLVVLFAVAFALSVAINVLLVVGLLFGLSRLARRFARRT